MQMFVAYFFIFIERFTPWTQFSITGRKIPGVNTYTRVLSLREKEREREEAERRQEQKKSEMGNEIK